MLSQSQFQQALLFGQLGESYIANFMRNRGFHVLPVYEKQVGNYKGPRIFMSYISLKKQLIAPDMLIIRDGKGVWLEAKHKSHFTWYGKGQCWTTGINKHCFDDYLLLQQMTQMDVWLFFLHSDNQTWTQDVRKWNAPPICPTGLFAGRLAVLARQIDHIGDFGTSGMVYWRDDQLTKLE